MLRMNVFDVIDQSRMYGCRLDWCRLVARRTLFDFAQTQEGLQEGLKSIMPDMLQRDVFAPWRCNQYQGVKYGAYAIGVHGDDVMLEARGEAAEDFYAKFYTLAPRATRLDICYDIEVKDVAFPLAEMMYHEREQRLSAARTAGNQAKGGIINRGRGVTFEVARRDGEKYFRLYDKSAEQGWPVSDVFGRFWRYELEVKRDCCQQVHEAVLASHDIRGTLSAALQAHLLEISVEGGPLRWLHRTPLPLKARKTSSIEGSLRWLSGPVRSTINKLFEQGFEGDIMDALALVDFTRMEDIEWQSAMEQWQS